MATREKNIWILLVFLLAGLVIGGLLGELASKVDFLWGKLWAYNTNRTRFACNDNYIWTMV